MLRLSNVFIPEAGKDLAHFASLVNTLERLQLATPDNIARIRLWQDPATQTHCELMGARLQNITTVLNEATQQLLLDPPEIRQRKFEFIVAKLTEDVIPVPVLETLYNLRQMNQSLQSLEDEDISTQARRELILTHPNEAKQITESFKILHENKAEKKAERYILASRDFSHVDKQAVAHVRLLEKNIDDDHRHQLLAKSPVCALSIAEYLLVLEQFEFTSSDNKEFSQLLFVSKMQKVSNVLSFIGTFITLSRAKISDKQVYELLASLYSDAPDLPHKFAYVLAELNPHGLLTQPRLELLKRGTIIVFFRMHWKSLLSTSLLIKKIWN